MFYTYIIFSDSIGKYYSGHTNKLSKRIRDHNSKKGYFTSKGAPWSLIQYFTFSSRKEAINLERIIKKRGAERFLDDLKQGKYRYLFPPKSSG